MGRRGRRQGADRTARAGGPAGHDRHRCVDGPGWLSAFAIGTRYSTRAEGSAISVASGWRGVLGAWFSGWQVYVLKAFSRLSAFVFCDAEVEQADFLYFQNTRAVVRQARAQAPPPHQACQPDPPPAAGFVAPPPHPLRNTRGASRRSGWAGLPSSYKPCSAHSALTASHRPAGSCFSSSASRLGAHVYAWLRSPAARQPRRCSSNIGMATSRKLCSFQLNVMFAKSWFILEHTNQTTCHLVSQKPRLIQAI